MASLQKIKKHFSSIQNDILIMAFKNMKVWNYKVSFNANHNCFVIQQRKEFSNETCKFKE